MARVINPDKEYINNKDFYTDIVAFLKQKEVNPDIIIPRHIVEYFLILAQKLATNWKFYSYDYELKKNMVSEGVMTCVRYVDKFKYQEYDNPFAYYTSFIYNAFIQLIKKEKENIKIKNELIDNYIHESIYNYNLSAFLDENIPSFYTDPNCHTHLSLQDEEFIPVTVMIGNKKILIKNKKEWIKYSLKKILKKYKSVLNIPKTKKFGRDLDIYIRKKQIRLLSKGKNQTVNIEDIERNYKNIIVKESKDVKFISDEKLWDEEPMNEN